MPPCIDRAASGVRAIERRLACTSGQLACKNRMRERRAAIGAPCWAACASVLGWLNVGLGSNHVENKHPQNGNSRSSACSERCASRCGLRVSRRPPLSDGSARATDADQVYEVRHGPIQPVEPSAQPLQPSVSLLLGAVLGAIVASAIYTKVQPKREARARKEAEREAERKEQRFTEENVLIDEFERLFWRLKNHPNADVRTDAAVDLREQMLQSFSALDRARIQAESDGAMWRARASATTGAAIPPDKLAALLKLAHPDKHQNSPLANETTQWLLAMRSQQKRAA
jgi:hypothetical protein